jgi:hypothetical protein
MRSLMLCLALLLGACAAPETQIVGPYASRLSATDIDEINALTAADLARLGMHVTGPPLQLQVVRPDYVHVQAPITGNRACNFDVMKRRGHWIVDGHGGGVHGLAPGENVVVE